MRISDWSSDVCSSDLSAPRTPPRAGRPRRSPSASSTSSRTTSMRSTARPTSSPGIRSEARMSFRPDLLLAHDFGETPQRYEARDAILYALGLGLGRSEEHTSELQSLMRNSYAVFCLK